MSQPLAGQVAIVTGASRGAGRGIACVLGEAGATVYVTGRTSRATPSTSHPYLTNCTVEDTAALVTARGGQGVAVVVDHTQDAAIDALFAQVQREQGGRLDILVNNVWGGYEGIMNAAGVPFTAPFWEQPLDRWGRMFRAGLRAHFVASQHAAKLMIARQTGLIVHTSFWDDNKYLGIVPYDVAKAAINRMALGMARDLQAHGVAVMALSPGWMRTEDVLWHMTQGMVKPLDIDYRHFEGAEKTESMEYIGRAVLALATDKERMSKSGGTYRVADLAQEYGFTDIDGRWVPPFVLPEN